MTEKKKQMNPDEQRIDFKGLDTKIDKLDTKLDNVEKRLDAKIDKLDAKIDQVEKRLDAKIDSKIDIAVESMKAYTDVKFSQVQSSFQLLGDKLDTSVKGIVNLIERGMGNQAKIEDSVQNHEQRICLLETKAG